MISRVDYMDVQSSFEFSEETYDLGDRELEILKALNQEDSSTVAFQGLKRKLGMHQESLSRALTRLHRDGLVEKTPDGYRIGKKVGLPSGADRSPDKKILPIIQAYIPHSIDMDNLVSDLKGTWFGGLRWLGLAETDTEKVLTWITENGESQLDLRFARDSMIIEAQVNISTNIAEAITAAHEIYSRVSSLYTKTKEENLGNKSSLPYAS